MKYIIFIIVTIIGIFFGCSKKELLPDEQPYIPEQWEKYVGDYKVYDTIGNYMYKMSISHLQSSAPQGFQPLDSLTIVNFADTFDITFQFIPNYTDQSYSTEYLNIQFHDSLADYNNKMWWVGSAFFDTTTTVKENSLINDTMIMYFEMDNIKFYINEAQPYYYCKCKQVAVKQ